MFTSLGEYLNIMFINWWNKMRKSIPQTAKFLKFLNLLKISLLPNLYKHVLICLGSPLTGKQGRPSGDKVGFLLAYYI